MQTFANRALSARSSCAGLRQSLFPSVDGQIVLRLNSLFRALLFRALPFWALLLQILPPLTLPLLTLPLLTVRRWISVRLSGIGRIVPCSHVPSLIQLACSDCA